jgi:hypothetical protein
VNEPIGIEFVVAGSVAPPSRPNFHNADFLERADPPPNCGCRGSGIAGKAGRTGLEKFLFVVGGITPGAAQRHKGQ